MALKLFGCAVRWYCRNDPPASRSPFFLVILNALACVYEPLVQTYHHQKPAEAPQKLVSKKLVVSGPYYINPSILPKQPYLLPTSEIPIRVRKSNLLDIDPQSVAKSIKSAQLALRK
jgi:hypothetical protein